MNIKMSLALIWTIVLISDILSAYSGNEPNWMLVFCPLILLVFKYWNDYFTTR